MKNYFALCLLLFVLVGCSFGDVPVTLKSTDGSYSLDLPMGYTENKTLNDEATFSYSNLDEEVYVIVIAEEKSIFKKTLNYYNLNEFYSNNLDDYSEVCLNNLKNGEDVSIYKYSNLEKVEISGKKGFSSELYGRIDDLDVYYYATFVEGKSMYYQILSWTLVDRAEKNMPIFKSIHQSFKEL